MNLFALTGRWASQTIDGAGYTANLLLGTWARVHHLPRRWRFFMDQAFAASPGLIVQEHLEGALHDMDLLATAARMSFFTALPGSCKGARLFLTSFSTSHMT